MPRARIARPGLDADPSRNPRKAPEKNISVARYINPKITAGINFFQLNPLGLQIGETNAVVLKEVFRKNKMVTSILIFLPLKTYTVVLDTPPGRERTPEPGMEAQLHRHIACSKIGGHTCGG